jgi:hypothetical protein
MPAEFASALAERPN